ncbi:Dephospho-CoA kinase [compost metagenome]
MFTDKVAKKNIENMMHKNIVSEMMIKATRAFIENKENNINRPIVFDAALLIEAELHKHVSKLIVVNIDPKEQLRRLMNRNGFSEDEAQMRINAQMSSEERLKYADYVLDNNQDLEHLKLQIYKIMEDLGHTK